uniref:Uncharacterized protein n=1 Tax=Salmonella enterica subsp. enterica serovar London TaxID=149390 RepID=A0A3G8EV16_SALET|nr:hypothetical protein KADIGFNM_00235 [Salmonella enterica subsp. enterica serovar London]AZF85739.1 hypothetical protein KADIGFNM_00402 [Salmonella enterica subsp. enterica serovar London]
MCNGNLKNSPMRRWSMAFYGSLRVLPRRAPVAFSLSVAFLPDCGRADGESAALLVDEVLPEQPMRHGVELPFQLRSCFQPPEIMGGAGHRLPLIATHLSRKRAIPTKWPRRRGHPDPAFWIALNLNVHFTCCFSTCVCRAIPRSARFRWSSADQPRAHPLTHTIAHRWVAI